MNTTLICPTNFYGGSATRGIYYPMGILIVGSLVKDTFPSWDIKIVDGELHSEQELQAKIRGTDVLGLSANTNNYQHCLNLARYAKEQGIQRVVIGGPHASAVLNLGDRKIPMAELILQNRGEIDAVIVNDGEESYLEYLVKTKKGETDLSGIQNLFWRVPSGEIKHNQIIPPTRPPRFTDMNFELMDFEQYWREHKKEFPAMDEHYIEGFTHVGCTWRDKVGCTFCDIPYPFNNYQAPGKFWRDLKEARDRIGVKSFKDYGDCLTGNSERVKALLDGRPADMQEMQISCYGRSSEISEEMADLLRDLNVRYVYVGFDSGSKITLRTMKSGYGPKANYTAIERLERRGINITGSLILGAAEEDEISIAETEAFAREAVRHKNVTQLHCAILTPFPGAPMNLKFLRSVPEFAEKDVWDTEQTTRFWIEKQCKVSYEYIEKKAKEINDLNPSERKRYFGLKRE